jgi:hypothetical protein
MEVIWSVYALYNIDCPIIIHEVSNREILLPSTQIWHAGLPIIGNCMHKQRYASDPILPLR